MAVPAVTACDGILLTDPDAAAFRSPGITAAAGPNGAAAWRIGVNDDDRIELKDTACLRLGKDASDFTVSMWLKLTGDSQVIGTSDQYGFAPGFVLYSRTRADGWLELVVQAGPLPSEPLDHAREVVASAPFRPGEWMHVALVYDSNGPGKAARFTLSLNLATSSGEAPIDVYRPGLRIGDQGYGRSAAFDVSEMRSYARALADTELKALALDKGGVAGLSGAELTQSIDRLSAHVNGTSLLQPAALDAEVARLQRHSVLLDTDVSATRRALDLVAAWEAQAGPLFISADTRNGISSSATGSDPMHLPLAMAKVHQAVLDNAYTPANVQNCASTFDGRRWRTSDYFPGSAAPPADPGAEHRSTIDATVPAFWGRPVSFATEPAVRPTGLYLSPGGVAEVTVPDAMVGTGFQVMVGAHTHDLSHKSVWNRLPRVSKRYPIAAKVTRIANPLGGGVYILAPYLADLGLQTVSVRGAIVEAPFFSARRFDKTTNEQWRTRRTAPAPWADFESDRFMMQVPSSWIFAFDDPTSLMQKWDTAMDGYSEAMGYPADKRNRTVMYEHVDTQIWGSVFGIGYPFGNTAYDPRAKGNGNADHWFLRNPTASEVEFHELGHAHLPTQFRGETEAIVNLQYSYVQNVKFGVDFDKAFADSFGPSYGSAGLTPDEAAVDWMITDNFRNGAEMDDSNTIKDEFRYQHRGYAKYADVARTFGWAAFTGFRRQEHLDFMARTPGDGLSDVDSRILRMSVAAQADLTPLIHFWGIHPVNAAQLRSALAAKGIAPSVKVRALLERYATLVPRDNAEFNALYRKRYPAGCPAGSNPAYGCGWYEALKATYGDAQVAQAQAVVRNIVQTYFP